jgi:hypothetical protein
MKRRTVLLVVVTVALLIAGGSGVWWYWRMPPAQVAALPPADGYLYVNVAALRTAGLFKHAIEHENDPGYQRFVTDTGFDFERDLNSAAFAIHNGAGPDYPRYSEVFTGRMDGERLLHYLRTLATSSTKSHGTEVLAIPHEGRTVRVALPREGIAVVSNTDSPAAVEHMIAAYTGGRARPPELLRARYGDVPLGSVIWAILNVPSSGNSISVPGSRGWSFPLQQIAGGSVVVGSMRYAGSLQLRIDALADSEERAHAIAENMNSFLAIYRTAERAFGARASDADIKAAIQTLRVEQKGKHATLLAEVPARVLEKIASPAGQ